MDANISYDACVLIKIVLKEYDKMKDKITILKT